jgi:hypothetical protein
MLDSPEQLEQQEPLAAKDLWDFQELPEPLVKLGLQELLEARVIVDQLEVQDLKEQSDNQDHKEQLAKQAQLDHRVTEVQRVHQGQVVQRVPKVPKVSKVKLEVRATVVEPVLPDPLERVETLDRLVLRAKLAMPDLRVRLDLSARSEQQEPLGQPDLPGLQDTQASKDRLDSRVR